MFSQLSGSTFVPPNPHSPIYPKAGKINGVQMRYCGYGMDGQPTQYEVSKTVASVLDAPDLRFSFANAPSVPYCFSRTSDGWVLFVGECGEVAIPQAQYERLMQVHNRTVRGRGRTGRGNPSSNSLFNRLDAGKGVSS